MTQNKSKSENGLDWDEQGTPISRRFDDPYYSKSDGRAETRHVFIDGNDLPSRWSEFSTFTMGELGFGTGLNFLETARLWLEMKPDGARLQYVSFEQFPLNASDMKKALSRWPELDDLAIELTNLWNLEKSILECAFIDDINLVVYMGDANLNLPKMQLQADAWYLDGFAPSRNPELWNSELMKQVFDNTASGGTFATYSCAGFVRRNLEEAGFWVERRPGFGGKREMLSGQKAP